MVRTHQTRPPPPANAQNAINRLKSVNSSRSHSPSISQSLHVSHLGGDSLIGPDVRGLRSLALISADEKDNIPCQRFLHDNLRAVWHCQELQRWVCYCCAEMLTDSGYALSGGLPELHIAESWIASAQSETDLLFQLNSGQEMILNLAMLRCPCGTPFQHSTQSAICSMCCNATCSATCHKQLVQDQGMCFYNLNYLPAARPEVHGCRDVRWCVIERSPPGTYLSRVCGPRYLEAITGPDPNTLLVRRGYGQYGQPLQSTLDALTPLPAEAQRPRSVYRRNLCRCRQCGVHQPHAVLHRRCRQDADVPVDDSQGLGGLPPQHPLSASYRAAAAGTAAGGGGGARDGSRVGGSRRSTMASGAGGESQAPSKAGATAAAGRSRGSVHSRTGGQSRSAGSELLPDITARTGTRGASGSLGGTGWEQQSRKVRFRESLFSRPCPPKTPTSIICLFSCRLACLYPVYPAYRGRLTMRRPAPLRRAAAGPLPTSPRGLCVAAVTYLNSPTSRRACPALPAVRVSCTPAPGARSAGRPFAIAAQSTPAGAGACATAAPASPSRQPGTSAGSRIRFASAPTV